MPLHAVLFDLFHTLIDVNRAPGRSTAEILGLDPARWNLRVIEESRHHALGAIEDPFESVRTIVHGIDPAIPDEKVREAVAGRAARFRHALLEVRADVLETLDRLRERGLSLGLISNAYYDEIAAWPESPLALRIDVPLFSCHEKIAKPDPAIYRLAASRIGVEPESCLYVGDGGSREHEGARAAGMRTVLILGMLEETLPAVAATRPRDTDWVVRAFPELLDVVAAACRDSAAPPVA
ncbi:MAG: HAD family hydrolase [Candidatus Eisenbacteria bacterium]|nr:HAD family hydrolase [Candidatus Eisenbacteria bacterium]